jgi:hypothetical protein
MCSERKGDPPAHRQDDKSGKDEKRYEVAADVDDTWQVIDTMTHLPAASNGREFVRLGKQDAEDLADELNTCEAEGRASPLV